MKSIYFWILIHRLWTLYNQFYKITYSARSVQYSTKTIFILSTSIYDLVLICICLSLSSSSSSGDISIKSWTIEILVLTSWIPASKNFLSRNDYISKVDEKIIWKESFGKFSSKQLFQNWILKLISRIIFQKILIL